MGKVLKLSDDLRRVYATTGLYSCNLLAALKPKMPIQNRGAHTKHRDVYK